MLVRCPQCDRGLTARRGANDLTEFGHDLRARSSLPGLLAPALHDEVSYAVRASLRDVWPLALLGNLEEIGHWVVVAALPQGLRSAEHLHKHDGQRVDVYLLGVPLVVQDFGCGKVPAATMVVRMW